MSTPRGRLFWTCLVAGWAITGYGIAGIFADRRDTDPSDLARWVLGAALAHDVLLAPAVCLAGVVLARLVPARWRALVSGALIVTAVVVLFSVPLVRGYGTRPDNPTVNFRHYGSALAWVVGGIWGVTALLALVSLRRRPARSGAGVGPGGPRAGL